MSTFVQKLQSVLNRNIPSFSIDKTKL